MVVPQDPISQAHSAAFAVDQITPSDLKLIRAEQVLKVAWRDGRNSVYPAALLRRTCPCATCRTDRDAQDRNPLHILKNVPPAELVIASAQLVGNYALQLFWSDGHGTGIYDFRYLRSLDAGG